MKLALWHDQEIIQQITKWSMALFLLGVLVAAVQLLQLVKAREVVSDPITIGKVDSIEQGRQQSIDEAKREGKTTYSFTTGKMPPPMEAP